MAKGMILENAVERNANIVGPHPRPFSRRAKGVKPLALRETAWILRWLARHLDQFDILP